jgi:hypothetical protein
MYWSVQPHLDIAVNVHKSGLEITLGIYPLREKVVVYDEIVRL